MIAKKRKIQSGKQFDSYFPKAKAFDEVILKTGSVEDTVSLSQRTILNTLDDTQKIASKLRGDTRLATAKNIYDFIINFIQYEYDQRDGDMEAIERVRTPARTWADRKIGSDCEDYSIFISSILMNLGLPHSLRMTKYDNKPNWQHIYVVMPSENGTTITIDPVVDWQFNYEVPYSAKKDFPMPVRQSSLAGISSNSYETYNPTTMMGIDALEFSSGFSGLGNADNFNEQGYLMLYPDVRKAVQSGTHRFKSGLDHYLAAGKFEGRVPDYDEQAYLKLNPDVDKAVKAGVFRTGAEHFLKHGRKEGRKYSLAHLSAANATANATQVATASIGGSDMFSSKNLKIAGGAAAALALGYVLLK